MPFDLKLYNTCDHKVSRIKLDILGTSPSFTANLPSNCDGCRATTFIREYNREEAQTVVSKPIIGITNYAFNADKSGILFGVYSVTPTTNFVDNNTNIIPNSAYYIDYVSTKVSCPKCLGSGLAKDLGLDAYGKVRVIDSKERVRMLVVKALLTDLESNEQDVEYGSGMNSLIGGEINEFTLAILQKYIQDCINHLRIIQQNANIDLSETIIRLADLVIVQSVADPSSYDLKIVVMNALDEYIDIYINLAVK